MYLRRWNAIRLNSRHAEYQIIEPDLGGDYFIQQENALQISLFPINFAIILLPDNMYKLRYLFIYCLIKVCQFSFESISGTLLSYKHWTNIFYRTVFLPFFLVYLFTKTCTTYPFLNFTVYMYTHINIFGFLIEEKINSSTNRKFLFNTNFQKMNAFLKSLHRMIFFFRSIIMFHKFENKY